MKGPNFQTSGSFKILYFLLAKERDFFFFFVSKSEFQEIGPDYQVL